ncbi:hypothetical protein [Kordia jejudonensis]|uniref:hypothetical protein n=1 Tax=Kordia jejudonensis TaxID=1348245 RepID=UPI0006298EFF|nr:hypothetical protein [Kordia jejudonensis]
MENLPLLIITLIIGIAIGYFICKKLSSQNPPSTNPDDVTNPDGKISVSESIALHKNYKNTRYNVINEVIGNSVNNTDFKDTQFVWFSYDKIKSYMKYLDTIERKNPSNHPISGIRIYFGAYDANGNDKGEFKHQQTIFFTPTIHMEISDDHHNMRNLPFSIIPDNSSEPLVGRYEIIRELLLEEHKPGSRFEAAMLSLNSNKKYVSRSQESTENDDGTSASFNMGQLSPPPSKKQ